MSKKRVVVVEVGKVPVVREVTRGFEEVREIIGGYIERARMGAFDCLVDEDGLPKKLPFNRLAGSTPIHGTFVVSKLRNGGDGLGQLTLVEANRIAKELS